MQRGERQSTREDSKVKVTALREQFRAASKPGKPAKAAKHAKNAPIRGSSEGHKPKRGHREEQVVDRREEEMAKAEKLAHMHHTTSLLKSKPKNNRFKDHKEKKPQGILLQLLVVMLLAGGGAVALDPSILPQEVRTLDWQGMKYQFDVWMQELRG